jgi:hypothetical protein
MATNYTNTLAGMLLLNDARMADIYPNGVLDDAPVIAKAAAIPASAGGTLHKYLRRSAAATVTFRELNTGVANTAETFDDVDCVCKILDASFTRDVALADAFRKGRSAYIQRETQAALRSGMYGLELALFANGQSTQFPGFMEFEWLADTNVSGSMVVDAGGTGGKSVYLIRWGEDATAIVAGNEGNMSMLWDDDNPTIVQVTNGAGVYSAYRVTLQGYFGLQVGSKYDVVRIANLDATSDDLLTDDLLSTALSKFPAARPPNMIVMNRTALAELQQSRTATNPTGAPAPFPSEAFGVPITVTDALGNSEAVVNTTTTTTTSTTTT